MSHPIPTREYEEDFDETPIQKIERLSNEMRDDLFTPEGVSNFFGV